MNKSRRFDSFARIRVKKSASDFSDNKKERCVQIRFLTNACVDTMVDYFKGNIDLSLDEVGEIIAMLSEYKR